MIKLIYLVSFLFVTIIQINASHLEDIDLNATQAILTSAKSSFASKSNRETLYQNIYNEARKRTPLKGSDAESLFLDLYISTCFLAHQEKGQQPESLSDDLYSQMLAPLGGTPYAHLSALELTGILSRVRGIHKSDEPSKLDPFHNTFANLMTGRGRFKLKESTEEKKQQLMMDIYRYYNLNHPIIGQLNKNPKLDLDSLWTEITGDSFDLATHLSSGSHDIHQEHAFNCFIISYLASDSPAYRLLVDYEDAPIGILNHLKRKLGEKNYRKHEQQIRGHFFYFYKTISSQIMGGQYTEFDQYIRDKSQCDRSRLKIMDAFYSLNLKNGTLNVAKINHQIQLASDGDIIPSLQSGIESLLKSSRPFSNYYGFHQEEKFSNDSVYNDQLAASLGALSSQVALTPYAAWVAMMDILVGKGTWDRERQAKKVWDVVNGAVGADQALRKGLFSFLEHTVGRDRVFYAKEQKVNDPRFVLQKTQKEIDEDEKKKQAAETQFARLPAEKKSVETEWNIFLELGRVIENLDNGKTARMGSVQVQTFEEAVWQTSFMPSIQGHRLAFKKAEFKAMYKKLCAAFHPDKNGNDASPYKAHFKRVEDVKEIIESTFGVL
jgi:hypothetical protein